MPVMPTAKAPSRLLANPPVWMRRVAAKHGRICQCSLHDCLVIRQRQERGLVRFHPVASSVHLDVTTQDFDGISIDCLIKTSYQSVVPHHQRQS